ncbi:MAG: hypothetical protein V9G19_08605 [Tetrasphaera sp.]
MTAGRSLHPVTLTDAEGQRTFLPRPIDERNRATMPTAPTRRATSTPRAVPGDSDYQYDGSVGSLPEDWIEDRSSGPAVRTNRRPKVPVAVHVAADGRPDPSGRAFWFLKGRLAFCPACNDQPSSACARTLQAGRAVGRRPVIGHHHHRNRPA